ncbi:MAG: hypothetical protein WDW38_006207 [Sanguina aurantia]
MNLSGLQLPQPTLPAQASNPTVAVIHRVALTPFHDQLHPLQAAAATAHPPSPRLQTPPSPSSTEWPLHPFMTSCIPCKLQLPQPTLPAQASNPTVAVIHRVALTPFHDQLHPLQAAAATAHPPSPGLQTPPSPSSTEWPLHPFMTSCIPCKLQLPQPTLPAQASNPTVAVIHRVALTPFHDQLHPLQAAAATAHPPSPGLQTPPSPSSTEWPLHPFMTSCIPCKLQLPQPTLPAPGFKPHRRRHPPSGPYTLS